MATARTINIVTWNINGLKQKKYQKFQEVYNAADVVFLQETHIGVGKEHGLDIEDEWKIYFTQYTSSRKGSAILVKKTLDFELISQEKDVNGAYLVLKCKLEGQPYTLVSVYNHHRDMETLDQLSKYLQQMASGVLVIGGDFNTVLNPFVDKRTKLSPSKVTNNTSHNKLRCCLEKFMKSLQLVDVWRRINPATRNYTFIKHNMESRLDYFFIPEECMWRVKRCGINMIQRSDHQPLVLEVNNFPVTPCKKDQELEDHIGQLLHHKKEFGIVEADFSINEDIKHAINEIDIVTAIQSLQVSDTPRPDGVSVTFYKNFTQDLIPYLKALYSRMHSGSFDFQKTHFCASIQEPHGGQQHFFNVDYLIIATILARRLDDHLDSQSMRQKSNTLPSFWITFKTLHPRVKWSYIKNALEEHKQFKSTLCQDFVVMLENLLRISGDSECSPESYTQLCQGCPITPVLMTLILKSISLNLIGHLEQHSILVFRQSVIICVQQEDQDEVEVTLVNISDDLGMSDIVVLSRGNGVLNVRECEVENWEFDSDGEAQLACGEEDEVASCSDQEESAGINQESGYDEDDVSDMEDEFHEDGSKLMPTFQHRQTMYAVVTLDSKEVVVVATNWLTEDRQQTHWPPYKSPVNLMEAVEKRIPPLTKQWEKINVTFFGEFGTYQEAKHLQQLLSASKVPKEGPSQMFGPAPLKRRKLHAEKNPNPSAMLPPPSQSTSTTVTTRPTVPRPQSGSSPKESDKLMKMLKEINKKVQENSVMLKQLLRKSEVGLSCSTSMLSETFQANLPLNSLEELDMIENTLKDETTRQNVIEHLSRLGGSGQREIMRKIMASVLTDDLAKAFNWQGRLNKKAMCSLELTRVIKVAAQCHEINDAEAEKEIKNWLRRNTRKKPKDFKDKEAGNPIVYSVTDTSSSDTSGDPRAGYDSILP